LSNRDVARFARTGGLDDRLAQAATEFITGRGTQQQKDQAVRYLSAVYRGALLEKRKLYVDQAERLGYNQSPEYRVTLAQLDRELAKFREVRPQQPAAPVAQPAQAPRATTGNPLVDKYLNQ
jgi:lipopolysaccharide biosynthesis regulator YciM